MGQVIQFKRSDRRARQRRTARVLAHFNGFLVELTDLSLSGLGGGTVELLSYADINLVQGERAELRLPRPVLEEDEPDFGHPTSFSAPIPVTVLRTCSGTRSFGGRFEALSEVQIELIRDLMSRGGL